MACMVGKGIDIGCGTDPLRAEVRCFDVADGDANRITAYVREQFDFVYSSHCLEHMHDPRSALREWWQLVKPRGHLIFIVPDEDLYEQGCFPSRFNSDHKTTFTVSKSRSWSPVSHNVLDLARGLPDGELVSLVLQDTGYDRALLRHENAGSGSWLMRSFARVYLRLARSGLPRTRSMERWRSRYFPIDQTMQPDVLAQIQCIVRKIG